MQATAFVAHPYEIPTVGWPSDIEGWKIEDLRGYYQRYYAPNNAVMFVVGDVTPAEVFALADKYFASDRGTAAARARHDKEPAQLGERRIRIERESQTPLARNGLACVCGEGSPDARDGSADVDSR